MSMILGMATLRDESISHLLADPPLVWRVIARDDLQAWARNPADMMKKEIYPEIWDRPPDEDDTLGYLLEYVQTLRGFLARAVEQAQGLLVYLT